LVKVTSSWDFAYTSEETSLAAHALRYSCWRYFFFHVLPPLANLFPNFASGPMPRTAATAQSSVWRLRTRSSKNLLSVSSRVTPPLFQPP
jgi:hypothetical protein